MKTNQSIEEIKAALAAEYAKGREHNDVAISQPLREQLAAERENSLKKTENIYKLISEKTQLREQMQLLLDGLKRISNGEQDAFNIADAVLANYSKFRWGTSAELEQNYEERGHRANAQVEPETPK